MTRPHSVPDNYRGRDEMTLVEFVEDYESCHFRTPYDTGANHNAMFIWNGVRQLAGLEALTEDDLIERYYVKDKGMTMDEARAAHKEFEEWYQSIKDERALNELKRKGLV